MKKIIEYVIEKKDNNKIANLKFDTKIRVIIRKESIDCDNTTKIGCNP